MRVPIVDDHEVAIESNGSGTCVLANIPVAKEERPVDTEPIQAAAS